jgi:hypothetical protein
MLRDVARAGRPSRLAGISGGGPSSPGHGVFRLLGPPRAMVRGDATTTATVHRTISTPVASVYPLYLARSAPDGG